VKERERERESEKEGEMYNMIIEFISLLLTMADFFIFKRNDGCLGTF
jgi:hypothetical protein